MEGLDNLPETILTTLFEGMPVRDLLNICSVPISKKISRVCAQPYIQNVIDSKFEEAWNMYDEYEGDFNFDTVEGRESMNFTDNDTLNQLATRFSQIKTRYYDSGRADSYKDSPLYRLFKLSRDFFKVIAWQFKQTI